jgi:hypothetical protein
MNVFLLECNELVNNENPMDSNLNVNSFTSESSDDSLVLSIPTNHFFLFTLI